MYQRILKPFLDFFCAFFGLMILSPIFILITVIQIFTIGNPFFTQLRPGLNGKLFKIMKFKTMTAATDSIGNLLPDNLRTTPFGIFLRKTSLDEIPQLFNVLKGEMSLVGPRPMLPYYLDLYNDFQRRRNEVKPGITGWAQINGRNNVPWKERFEMDVWYVEKISFLLDLKILALTFLNIFSKENQENCDFKISRDFEGN